MKIEFLLLIIVLLTMTNCSIRLNPNFNYEELITPKEIKEDINNLKRNLEKRHCDINWEGNKKVIFQKLDEIKEIESLVQLDSFENRISSIINSIDDGHSGIVHQTKYERVKRNPFDVYQISDSIIYLKIGSFIGRSSLKKTLIKFEEIYDEQQHRDIIIDLRNNFGGQIKNVNLLLSYFLPSKTKLYEKVKVRSNKRIFDYTNWMNRLIANAKSNKYTDNKKLKGQPKIYLWINEQIASGSMLLTYHLKKHGAKVIGKKPKGLFNTFGQPNGYKLPNSKIIYTLAAVRLCITDECPMRNDDMISPDYIPNDELEIDDVIKFITENQK